MSKNCNCCLERLVINALHAPIGHNDDLKGSKYVSKKHNLEAKSFLGN